MRDFKEKLDCFARAVEQRDGPAFAALFTKDAIYHDAIYGAVAGRDAISKMLVEDWYKDGDTWLWDMINPVCDDQRGYVHYVASFSSLNRFSKAKRIVASGVGMFEFKDGLFSTYHEIANGTPALWDLNVRGDHLAQVVERQADAQRAEPELMEHYRGCR